jgi:hypothetical protein
MQVTFAELSAAASRLLKDNGSPDVAEESGWACAWLAACGYQGLEFLFEALDTTPPEARRPELKPDLLGLDLQNVSCVFLVPAISTMVRDHGRLFLRNVRHGLYLVPYSVKANIGIGCPVDPAFALGGERTKNPYEEKLAAAHRAGIAVADPFWLRASA